MLPKKLVTWYAVLPFRQGLQGARSTRLRVLGIAGFKENLLQQAVRDAASVLGRGKPGEARRVYSGVERVRRSGCPADHDLCILKHSLYPTHLVPRVSMNSPLLIGISKCAKASHTAPLVPKHWW